MVEATVVVGATVVVVVDATVVVGATVVVVSTVSEEPPQAEASKTKQTTTPNFFIPTSLAHHVGVPPVGYCKV
ncbi:MAG: hypothetical protein P8L35_07765 [Acidimicrobiales bacterium]|nr:hypothetical protein [Acidimicrobiales bacterium]